MDKDTKKLLAAAVKHGFTVTMTSKGHFEVRDADGARITTFSGSAGDVRSYRNGLAKLRAAGLEWPQKGKGRK